MYDTANVPPVLEVGVEVVLINGDTVLVVGEAPAIIADTALVPATENETVCPAQTGFGEATTVPVGEAITLTEPTVEKAQPSAFLPVNVNDCVPLPPVGVSIAVGGVDENAEKLPTGVLMAALPPEIAVPDDGLKLNETGVA